MACLEPLLTIAIPTYNRSGFLDKALRSISSQLVNVDLPIELIVSDNCSTDNTGQIVCNYINRGLAIRYIKNLENKGADFNIGQCYSEAQGKYVLTLGDDDILIEGALANILAIITNFPDLGILHLNWCLNTRIIQNKQPEIKIQRFDDYEHFLKMIGHNITFISGNIIRSVFIDKVELKEYYNTNLIQLPLFLNAIINSKYNLVLTNPTIAVPFDNSGGYSICTVFGKNIHSIFEKLSSTKKHVRSFNSIRNSLLTDCFPSWIRSLKSSEHQFENDDILKLLHPIYKSYLNYWLLNYVLIIQSNKLLKLTWPLFRYYAFAVRNVRKFLLGRLKYSTINLR